MGLRIVRSMRRKSEAAYRVDNWLLDTDPPQWDTLYYRGDFEMCCAIYEGLVRQNGAARLVRVADGKIVKEFIPKEAA